MQVFGLCKSSAAQRVNWSRDSGYIYPPFPTVFVVRNNNHISNIFLALPTLIFKPYMLQHQSSTMKSYHPFVPWFLILTGFSYANLNPFNALRKRESGAMSCYYALNIIDFSALCPSTDYPVNDQGLNVLEVLYFAMRSTTIPGDTIYQAQENIICVTHSPGPNVTFTAGAQAGAGPLSAGASVTFTFSLPGPDLGGK
jgi:hypothetical protein